MSKLTNQVRIIGGQWRGRKINFPDVAELRPTPDRVRETLFNWLAPVIHGAKCLDLFAGSGALGFEAASRGAAKVVMIDRSRQVIEALEQQITKLSAEPLISVFQREIPQQLLSDSQTFNIVFLDPPFRQNLIAPCCEWLSTHHYLAKDAYIYIEAEKGLASLTIPVDWQVVREKTAGQVKYYLLRCFSS